MTFFAQPIEKPTTIGSPARPKNDPRISKRWQNFIQDLVRRNRWKNLELARILGVSESYVSRWRRRGWVPKRSVVISLGMLTGRVHEALGAAGYDRLSDESRLSPRMLDCVRVIRQWDHQRQDELAEILEAFLA